MLPKNNRLTHRKDFDNVFKTGQSFFSDFIGVKITKNNLKNSRFGIIISTKVSKKAVTRNKIKRQIREIIHQNLKTLETGYDTVIICQPKIIKKEFPEIKKEILQNFKKLKLL